MRTHTQITDALKTSENSASPYITYVIRSGVSPPQRFLNEKLDLSPTDGGGPPPLLRVRISTPKLDEALPDLDHPPYSIQADDR